MGKESSYDHASGGLFVEYLKLRDGIQLMKSKHYHDSYEIYYYLGANMTYFVGDKNYILSKNDLLLIDKCVFHKTTYDMKTENERVLIEFNDNVFDIFSDENVKAKIFGLFGSKNKFEFENPAQATVAHSLIFGILSDYNSPSPYGLLTAKQKLAELCLYLAGFTETSEQDYSLESQKKSENNVMEIIKYINENYKSKISLDDLADIFFVNKYYLCHIFKKETGLSIIEFVNKKRLSEAEKLLRETDSSITDICYKVGFNSINHFLKLFKNTYTLTPKKFRNKGDGS